MLRKLFILVPILTIGGFSVAHATPVDTIIPGISLGSDDPTGVSNSLRIIALITVMSIAPAILVLMTSFTRIVVVFGFVRNALGTQSIPPNQVLIGLSLFMTFFIMGPTFSQLNQNALEAVYGGNNDPARSIH